jgi:hypothetical protein
MLDLKGVSSSTSEVGQNSTSQKVLQNRWELVPTVSTAISHLNSMLNFFFFFLYARPQGGRARPPRSKKFDPQKMLQNWWELFPTAPTAISHLYITFQSFSQFFFSGCSTSEGRPQRVDLDLPGRENSTSQKMLQNRWELVPTASTAISHLNNMFNFFFLWGRGARPKGVGARLNFRHRKNFEKIFFLQLSWE